NVYSIAGILDGTFGSITVTVLSVYDAGTEVNDFGTSAGNGLFGIAGGQNGPNQGANENSVITLAQGSDYLAYLNLAGVNVAPFDFSAYASIATITVSAVPIPAALPLLMSGIVGLGFLRHRNSDQSG
ncbi:MAG: VPLPA-CTERM sorting domain-containing protein, partial [Proteobacteria bacterium]|nr:VPLPA-CTERM sorting domain-containing protein [Pseudomonadota bacterium]